MSGALPPPPLNAPRGSKRWIFYQSLNGHREGPGTLTPSPALPPRRAPCFPPDTTWGREARLCSGTSSQCLPGCVRQRNVSAVNYKPKGSITLSPDGTSLNMSNRAVSLLQPEAGSCFPGEEGAWRETSLVNPKKVLPPTLTTYCPDSACLPPPAGDTPVPDHDPILLVSSLETLQMASVLGRLPRKQSLAPDLSRTCCQGDRDGRGAAGLGGL